MGRAPWLRRNAVNLVLVGVTAAAVYAFVRLGVQADQGSPEQTIFLGLVLAAVAALCTIVVRIVKGPEKPEVDPTLPGRIEAAQRLLGHAREVRDVVHYAWSNRHLLNSGHMNLRGDLEGALRKMRNQGFSEDVWIGKSGVDSVRRFTAAIGGLDLQSFGAIDEVLASVNASIDALRHDLLGSANVRT